ncbi:peroxisomal targeting signal 2 receptor [Phlebotomus papatasi]|uniref:peroxisomal targeting signal 2 receptor n=1 Tax=Phlebotomus papatasi TaxID=29031 RepID=UPI0024844C9E|nr:peroxisomal targeting signal 2 receptor [Phlebotomus papatasi]XP_055700843.1 peroxisomal targeting signal 2 receptor [Phlebotomus papatasi]XP_055700844.1 peroxisomal targeting signal 2 receptor [Phlebotomus papatasi]
MPTYLTPNRHGYSVRFSRFNADRLAVATSQFFGLAGGGTLFILELTPDGGIQEVQSFQWSDGLFDVVWSETPSAVITASGDGGLQLWNADAEARSATPQSCYCEHRKEVYSVDWSRTRQEQLMLSASWDCTIKLWDPHRSASISTYLGHSELVYSAMFSCHIPNTFASVGGDGYLKVWNTLGHQRPTAMVKAHDAEVLSCDWARYEQNLLATGGSDGLIRGFDLRNFSVPLFELQGCEYAVRRIRFSPFSPNIVAAVSYDSTTRIWDFQRTPEAIETIRHHSEFNYGLDWNALRCNQLADCGWDSLVHVFTPRSLSTPA